jgi:hypothetical protein
VFWGGVVFFPDSPCSRTHEVCARELIIEIERSSRVPRVLRGQHPR